MRNENKEYVIMKGCNNVTSMHNLFLKIDEQISSSVCTLLTRQRKTNLSCIIYCKKKKKNRLKNDTDLCSVIILIKSCISSKLHLEQILQNRKFEAF